MQRLSRQHLFRNYGDLSTLPPHPPLSVRLGESFAIETVDTGHMLLLSEAEKDKPCGPMSGNPSTGPVWVEGVKAGDVIALHIESLQVVGHTLLPIGGDSLLPKDLIRERRDFVAIEQGMASFAGGLRVPVSPMYGCFGVVPASPSPESWHHGGNLDIPHISAGNIVHVRCQRDGAWFCCGDGHALQGDGEMNGFALEVSLDGQLRIEQSAFQELAPRSMLIETPDWYITVGVEHETGDGVRQAVLSMCQLLARARDVDLLDAYQLVSHLGDLRLGAAWPLLRGVHIPIPMCVHMPRRRFGHSAR
jgi:amidase